MLWGVGSFDLLPVKSQQIRYDVSLRVAAWALLGATILAVLWARIHLASLPLERDEGEYAYTGRLLLLGIPPYKLAYSMKFPGTAAVYAVFLAIFGESSAGVHLGLILLNLSTIGLMFLLGKRLFDQIGGIVAACAYAILSLMPYVLGQAAHATHFVVLPVIAGTLLLLRALDRQSVGLIFASGCLFGLGFLMKQPGVLFVIFGVVYLLAANWRELKIGPAIFRNLLFLAGAIVPFVITCFVLWSAGVFGKFWFWTIEYAGVYGSRISIGEGLQIFAGEFPFVLGAAWPIWLVALIGLVLCLIIKPARTRIGFLTTFALFSLLAVSPGFYFRPHYFILLLPSISLLAGAAVTAGLKLLQSKPTALGYLLLLVCGVALAWPLAKEADFLFERPIVEANRMVNGINPFPESIRIADYIRAQSNDTDTVAVLGSEPEMYFYSRRLSATGYIYTYGLMEPQPYAHRMQLEMIHEIETARPRFLVVVAMNRSWLAGPDSDQTVLKWVGNYCDANYEEVGLINISERSADYYFSTGPPGVKPSPEHILIYRRKI